MISKKVAFMSFLPLLGKYFRQIIFSVSMILLSNLCLTSCENEVIQFLLYKLLLYAQDAFFDVNRIILEDVKHSVSEKRYFCIGKTDEGVLTVRFTMRGQNIRIFGAGYWRQGKKRYEEHLQ